MSRSKLEYNLIEYSPQLLYFYFSKIDWNLIIQQLKDLKYNFPFFNCFMMAAARRGLSDGGCFRMCIWLLFASFLLHSFFPFPFSLFISASRSIDWVLFGFVAIRRNLNRKKWRQGIEPLSIAGRPIRATPSLNPIQFHSFEPLPCPLLFPFELLKVTLD